MIGRSILIFIFLGADNLDHGNVSDKGDYNITESPRNRTPYILHHDIDANKNLIVEVNQYDEDFIMILSPLGNESAEDRYNLYVSNNGGRTIHLQNVMVDDHPIYVDEIQSVNDYFFCISYINRTYFYIDKNHKIHYLSKFTKNISLTAHQTYPLILQLEQVMDDSHENTYIMRTTSNYGQKQELHYLHVHNARWIHENPWCIVHLKNRYVFIDEAFFGTSTLFQYKNVEKFILGQASLLLITLIGGRKNIVIWDYYHKAILDISMPEQFNLKSVDQFSNYELWIYIVATNTEDTTCLFSASVKSVGFLQEICDLQPIMDKKCPVFFHPNLHQTLYVNIAKQNGYETMLSYIFMKKLFKMFFIFNQERCWPIDCFITFNIRCDLPPKYNVYTEEILTFSGFYSFNNTTITANFVSFDYGNTWRIVSNSKDTAVVLRFGEIILNIDKTRNNIIYSYNKGLNWYYYDVFGDQGYKLTSILTGHSNKPSVLIESRKNKLSIKLTYIDFDSSRLIKYPIIHIEETVNITDTNTIDMITHHHNRSEGTASNETDDDILDAGDKSEDQLVRLCPCWPDDLDCKFIYYSTLRVCFDKEILKQSEIYKICIPKNQTTLKLRSYHDLKRKYPRVLSNNRSLLAVDVNNTVKLAESCHSDDYTNSLLIYFFYKLPDPYMQFVPIMYPEASYLRIIYYELKNDMGSSMFKNAEEIFYLYVSRKVIHLTRHCLDCEYFEQELYICDNEIISTKFDPFYRLLFYLDANKNLYCIHMDTNFIKPLAKKVNSFAYDKTNVAISFITDNEICYYRLDSDIKCFKISTAIKAFKYVDDLSLLIILYQNSTLITIKNDGQDAIDYTKIQFQYDHVKEFIVIDKNLYFVEETKLWHADLTASQNKRLKTSKYYLHFKQNSRTTYLLKTSKSPTKCIYQCNPLIKSSNFCICQDDTNLIRKYVCDKSNYHCLKMFCSGYMCKNGKCLKNNVRCSMVDDCGDSSDEQNCDKFCELTQHLCRGICIDQYKICEDMLHIDESVEKSTSLPKSGPTYKFQITLILVVLFTLVILMIYQLRILEPYVKRLTKFQYMKIEYFRK